MVFSFNAIYILFGFILMVGQLNGSKKWHKGNKKKYIY